MVNDTIVLVVGEFVKGGLCSAEHGISPMFYLFAFLGLGGLILSAWQKIGLIWGLIWRVLKWFIKLYLVLLINLKNTKDRLQKLRSKK